MQQSQRMKDKKDKGNKTQENSDSKDKFPNQPTLSLLPRQLVLKPQSSS